MRVLGREEMQKLDSWAIKELGIPRIALMENAGRKVSEITLQEVKKAKSAAIICGKGGNGGDGLVSARFLRNAGVNVSVFLLCKKEELKDEQKTNLLIAQKMEIPILEIKADQDLKILKDFLFKTDVVIDAIFGIGFTGKASGIITKAIDLVNKTKAEVKDKVPYFVTSVDIPSGIDASTGAAEGVAIKADLTVTLAFPKAGLFSYPGNLTSGKIVIVDIGIPKINPLNPTPPTKKEEKRKVLQVTDIDFVSRSIPQRPPDAHKGTFGEVFILAGSPGMTGAAVLCGKGALRVGAGLVKIAVPQPLQESVDLQCAEIITIGLPDEPAEALKIIIKSAKKSNVISIGPGLSTQPMIQSLVKEFINTFKKEDRPIIIDADGLNAISDDPSILSGSKAKIILTPHPGEMSRLAKVSAEEIAKDRTGIALKLAKELKVTVVLKGAKTVIADSDGRLFINPTGNPGMASAGVGDILTGAIGGFIAQGALPFDAAIMGVYVHGMTGDIVARIKGEHGMIASDIVDSLPYTIESILRYN